MERWNLVLGGIGIVVAAVAFGTPEVLGLAVGAAVASLNFAGIHRLLGGAMRAEGQKRVILQVLLLAKMAILVVVVFLAIRFLPLSPIALAIGLSVFLLSIGIESARFALRPASE